MRQGAGSRVDVSCVDSAGATNSGGLDVCRPYTASPNVLSLK